MGQLKQSQRHQAGPGGARPFRNITGALTRRGQTLCHQDGVHPLVVALHRSGQQGGSLLDIDRFPDGTPELREARARILRSPPGLQGQSWGCPLEKGARGEPLAST